MKNSTTYLHKALIIASISFVFSISTQAAVFAKYDGIDGESKAQQEGSSPQHSTPKKVGSSSKPEQTLILPAVQSNREAARTKTGKSGQKPHDHMTGDEHEIEYDIAK